MLRLTYVFAALAVLAMAVPAGADLIISEVVDGTLSGGLPKFVELTNTGPGSVDLADYSIGNYNNGGTTLGGSASLVLSGTLGACESYVISYESGDEPGVGAFFTVYGFDPDNFENGAFINGDDVIALFLGPATGDGSDATLVDILGVIGVNGDGEPWDYTDSYAARTVLTANPVFTASEWVIPGLDGLESGGTDEEDAALMRDLTDPGVYEPCLNVPTEEATWGQIKSRFGN